MIRLNTKSKWLPPLKVESEYVSIWVQVNEEHLRKHTLSPSKILEEWVNKSPNVNYVCDATELHCSHNCAIGYRYSSEDGAWIPNKY